MFLPQPQPLTLPGGLLKTLSGSDRVKYGSQQLHADRRADSNTDLPHPGRAAKLKVCLPAVSPCSPCARRTCFVSTLQLLPSFIFTDTLQPLANTASSAELVSKLFTYLQHVGMEVAPLHLVFVDVFALMVPPSPSFRPQVQNLFIILYFPPSLHHESLLSASAFSEDKVYNCF